MKRNTFKRVEFDYFYIFVTSTFVFILSMQLTTEPSSLKCSHHGMTQFKLQCHLFPGVMPEIGRHCLQFSF